MANNVEIVEDYLCDLCDTLFNDGIICDKIFNPEEKVNRAANVVQIYGAASDQGDAIYRMDARVVENREKRSQCIKDIEILQKLTKNGVKLASGLAIYINIQYITSPDRTIVDGQSVYTISAYLNVTLI